MTLDAKTCLRHSANATYQTIEGEAVLIHMQTGNYYSLNDVGTTFWELLNGARTLGDCAAKIAAASGQVEQFLDRASRRRLSDARSA